MKSSRVIPWADAMEIMEWRSTPNIIAHFFPVKEMN